MTDDVQGIAAAQLRSIVDRILRLKEEQDAIGDDIKEVYLEAKSNGYDKTILGQVVSTLRKRAKNSADYDEKQAIFDLYMDAVDGGTKAATHTHEATKSAIDPKLVETIAQGVQTEIGRKALVAALDIMIEREESGAPSVSLATSSPGTEADADPEPHSNPRSPSNRDLSADDKASSEAGPQAEASLAGTGSEMLAGHEGHIAGEAATADLPTYLNLSGSPVPDGRAEEDDSSGPAASSSSATTIADLRLIDRVTKAKRKGIPANEAGDSARWQRLVKSGVFVGAGGRLFYRDFAPEHEVA